VTAETTDERPDEPFDGGVPIEFGVGDPGLDPMTSTV
jgi:hypothetical protein